MFPGTGGSSGTGGTGGGGTGGTGGGGGSQSGLPIAHGNYVALAVVPPGNGTLTTADLVKFYRKDQFGLWRLIAEVPWANGTVSYNDALMVDELTGLPVYPQIELPGGVQPQTLGGWKGCLVVGAQRKAWLSYVGLPNEFAPDPSQFGQLWAYSTNNTDPNAPNYDPNVPRTVYMSADRSEPVLGIVGLDELYLLGPRTTSAMTAGDTPTNLSVPRPLPGARGSLGYRAQTALNSGVLVGTKQGLYFYAASDYFTGVQQSYSLTEEEVTREVRGSWNQLVNVAATSGMIVSEMADEVWAVLGSQYLHRSRNGHWESGTLSNPLKGIIANQYNGFLCATSDGRLERIAPALSSSGATWTYTTGIIEGPRTRLKRIECFYQGVPSVTVSVWDGEGATATQTFSLADGKVTKYPTNPAALLQGYRYQVTCSGGAMDSIQRLDFLWEDQPGGRGN